MSVKTNNYPVETVIADKAYAVTKEGKLVPTGHKQASQIISHFPGQEIPAFYADQMGCLSEDQRSFKPRAYDDVPDTWSSSSSEAVADSATPAPTGMSPAEVEAKIAQAVAAANKANEAANQKIIEAAVAKAVAAAVKKTGA